MKSSIGPAIGPHSLLVLALIVLVTAGCEDTAAPSQPSTSPVVTPTPYVPTDVVIGNGWTMKSARIVAQSDVPQPTSDGDLEVRNVRLVSTTDNRDFGPVEAAFEPASTTTTEYFIEIEMEKKYYAHEVTEVWLELKDGRVVKWGDTPLGDADCEALIERTTYTIEGNTVSLITGCLPIVLNKCLQFAPTSCVIGRFPPGISEDDFVLSPCVNAGSIAGVAFDLDRQQWLSNPDPDTAHLHTWEYFYGLLYDAYYNVMQGFNCMWSTAPPEPIEVGWSPSPRTPIQRKEVTQVSAPPPPPISRLTARGGGSVGSLRFPDCPPGTKC